MTEQTKSIASESTSSTSAIYERYSNKKTDNSFAFLDNIFQHANVPNIITFIWMFFFFFQQIFVSLWIPNSNIWNNTNESRINYQFIKYISEIFLFSDVNAVSNKNFLILSIIFTILMIVLVSIIFAQLFIFSLKRRFYKSTLSPTRIVLELFPSILILPVSLLFGRSLSQIIISNNSIEIIIATVLSFIDLIIFLVIFTLYYYFLSYSPYLGTSLFAAFSLLPFIYIAVMNSFVLSLSFILETFYGWIIIVLIFLHAAGVIFNIILMFQRPFTHMSTNILFLAMIVTQIILDISILVTKLFKNVDGDIFVYITLAFIVLSIVISTVFYNLQAKYLHKSICIELDHKENNKENENVNSNKNIKTNVNQQTKSQAEEGIKMKYQALKLDISEFKALMYLNFAVSNFENFDLDFSLVKFLMQNYDSCNMICYSTKIVSFFPPESRLLNILSINLMKSRDLNIFQRFLVYQLNRIKILRQSSSSIQCSNKLREMSLLSKDLFSEIVCFFDQTSPNHAQLRKLRGMIIKTKALWEESLIEYPNSPAYSEGFCQFLIECTTDFSAAARQKHRASMIDAGRSYSVDKCFRDFVCNFPDYLKKRVIDSTGLFIHKQKKIGGSTSNSNSNSSKNRVSSFSTNGSNTMDNQMEETISKSLITHARTRLALQNATTDMKSKGSRILMLVAISIFVLLIGSCSFVFFFYYNHFNDRNQVADRIELSNQIRFNLFSSAASIALQLIENIGVFDDTIIKGDIGNKDNNLWFDPFFNKSNSWATNAMIYNVEARNYYNNFLENIAVISLTGANVYEVTGALITSSTNVTYCKYGKPLNPGYANLQVLLSNIFLFESKISGNDNYSYWFSDNDDYCALMKNLETSYLSFKELRLSLFGSNSQEYADTQGALDLIIYIMPASIFVVTFISFTISSISFLKEITNFMKMILNLDINVKHEAIDPIKKEIEHIENTKRAAERNGKGITAPVLVFFGICLICFSVLLLMQLIFYISEYNKRFNFWTTWIMNSRVCKSLSIELLLWSIEAIITTNSSVITKNNIFSPLDLFEILTDDMKSLSNSMSIITEDSHELPSPAKYDSDIGVLLHSEQCIVNVSDPSMHEFYRCSSIEQLVNFYSELINELVVKIDQYHGEIKEAVPLNVIHLSQAHVIPVLIKIDERFDELFYLFMKSFQTNMITFYVMELVFSIALFTIMLLFIFYLDSCFNTVLILLRRVNPIAVLGNADLIDYVLDRSSDKTSQTMTTSKSVIYKSSDCILCIGLSGVIETVNPSTTSLLGFSPEQLIGQPISIIISDSEKPKILSQMSLIKNKQSTPFYEDHTFALTDDDSQIPCDIKILGMTSNQSDNENIRSFVFILRDETELIEQQNEAENAKQQSETLLFQILPRNIVLRINQGEKDISFTVPSATIMFIDIVKFSEYASTLTPKEIMANLSTLFGAFDEAITKYELLLKIKLIGDVYMCAGGLFNHEDPPQNHAEQMIKFGSDALQILEEKNLKFNSVLNVRIGINTGGPLIAGVLGTDKPIFDIIGDPINIASRLQSTDIPGSIQISQDTYNLVNTNEAFSIEPRGEIFLKGKGKTKAFLVKQQKNFYSFQVSSSE